MLSGVIGAAMIAALIPATASAATPTGSITVDNVEDGVSITAYQVVTANVNEDGSPNDPEYTWNTKLQDFVKSNYPSYINASNGSVTTAFNKDLPAESTAAFFDKVAAQIRSGNIAIEAAKTIESGSASSNVLSDLPAGQYLVLIEKGKNVYRPSVANVTPVDQDGSWAIANPTLEIKESTPSIEKTESDNDTQFGLNDTARFQLLSDVPVYPSNSLDKTYAISDRLPAGLSFNNDVVVTGVKGSDSTILTADAGDFTQSATDVKGNATTFTLKFNYDKVSAFDAIKVTYSAKINDQAVITDGNTNTASIEYTNKPYDTDGYTTDTSKVTVYTYGIKVLKTDEDGKTPLSGAEFELKNDQGKVVSTQTSDKDGLLSFDRLDVGTYTITETKAPAGYVKKADVTTVTITDADKDGKVDGASTGYASVSITNSKSFELGKTGATGIAVLTAAGILLIAGGSLILMKKKANKNA